MSWTEEALCRQHDPEMWFASDPVPAQRICRRCPVKWECLDEALSDEPGFGVWAGHSARTIRLASEMGVGLDPW